MECKKAQIKARKVTPADSFYFKRILTFDEACLFTGYARSYMYKMTSAGIIPYSKPNGKTIFFDREKLEAWMLSNPNTNYEERQIEAATYVSTIPHKFK